MSRRCPECKLAGPTQRPSVPRPQGRRILAADGCASTRATRRAASAPSGPRRGRGEWRSPCSDTLVLGILICRKECITYANTYALNGILTRDSSDVAMLLQRLSTFNSGPRGRPADSARLRFDDAWKRPALAFVQLRVAFDLKRCRRHAALTSHGINWRHAGPRERGGPGRRLRRQRGRARSRPLGIRTPVRANP